MAPVPRWVPQSRAFLPLLSHVEVRTGLGSTPSSEGAGRGDGSECHRVEGDAQTRAPGKLSGARTRQCRTGATRPRCRAGGPGVRAGARPDVRQSGGGGVFRRQSVWGETLVAPAPDCPMWASLVTERLPVNLRHRCRLGRPARAPLCSQAPDLEVSLAPAPHATGNPGPRFSRTCF